MDNTLIKKQKFGLSAGAIKIFALAAMTLDHVGWRLIDRQLILRGLESYPKIATSYYLSAYDTLYGLSYSFHIIGRLAFPLFAFFVVEGVHHTRSFRRYALTMLAFAVISEIPFNLMYAGKVFTLEGQNVMFALLLCMTAVYALRKFRSKWYFALLIAGACAAAAYFLKVDYGIKAVIFACIVELLYNKKVLGFSLGCIVLGICKPWEFCCLLAVPLVWLYNGRRGPKLKYLFYVYYPLHFIIIYILSKNI